MALLSSPQPGLGGELVAGVVTRADPACPAVYSLSPLGCIPHGTGKQVGTSPGAGAVSIIPILHFLLSWGTSRRL